jgi:formylmethanofuran dehydrogenase subunit A
MTAPTRHLKNATVIDPSQQTPPRDLYIHDGFVVEKPTHGKCDVIDLTGHIILPGAIDMHTHLVPPAMGALRTLQQAVIPDDVSTELIGSPTWLAHQYLKLGYTMAVDAAIAPGDAPAARVGLRELAPLHTAFLLLLSHHGPLLELLQYHQWDVARDLAMHLFTQSGAMGIKLVNPGSMHAMDGPAMDVVDIDSTVEGMHATPRQVLDFFLDLSDKLHLAHPVHIHLPQLGTPQSCASAVQWLNAMAGRRAHIAHLQYDCYKPDRKWYLRSGVEDVLTALHANKQLTADVGLTGFGPAYALTADLALHDRLLELFGDDAGPALRFQWDGLTVFGLQPLHRYEDDLGYAMQWATGLELVLQADDLTQLSLTLDYPNGGAVSLYPQLIRCLMNKAYRDEMLKQCHPAATQATGLKQIKRELSFAQIMQLTRLSPAHALGLQNRGNLQIGSIADLAVYTELQQSGELFDQQPERLMVAGTFL